MAKEPVRTCMYCREKQQFDPETMTFVVNESSDGKSKRKFYHKDCLVKLAEDNEKEAKEKEFKTKEVEVLDRLVEVVGELHEAPKPPNLAYQLPREWYHMIQDIRNGSNRYTSKFKKRYKQGIPYEVMIDAYKMSKDAIKWAKMDKQFPNMSQEIRYCFAIMLNKIPDALKKATRAEQAEKVAKAKSEHNRQQLQHQEEREVSYKKKKASYDISDFLD